MSAYTNNVKRRISYILPAPTSEDSVPLLDLPPISTPRNGRAKPLIVHKPTQRNPFLEDDDGRDDVKAVPSSFIQAGAHRSSSTQSQPHPQAFIQPQPQNSQSRINSGTGAGAPGGRRRFSHNRSYLDDTSGHPRHCLGVAAIALDMSTVLANRSRPEGILYTGGRDGLVASWELGLPMKRRQVAKWQLGEKRSRSERRRRRKSAGFVQGTGGDEDEQDMDVDSGDSIDNGDDVWDEQGRPRRKVKWERLEEGGLGSSTEFDEYANAYYDDTTDGGVPAGQGVTHNANGAFHDDIEEEDEDEDSDTDSADDDIEEEDLEASEGLLGGSRPGLRRSHSKRQQRPIAFEDQWQVDLEALDIRPPPPTKFRQSVQTHTDWVNDILLCNMNQTVISASSDRTIRMWSPHSSSDSAFPSLVGVHTDYVKTLAFAKHPALLFSGGLDRHVFAWDVNNPQPHSPVLKLDFPETTAGEGPRGSVYALTALESGNLVAAGSPERVVRLWDPRLPSGATVADLIGHTDNIRAILMSEDGKYLLSGSSDSTIKLWSVAAQRCIHTYTHHTDSVWSLYSDHPNLERFYSGDRSGYLCVTDMEGCRNDYYEGECVVLAKEEVEDDRRGTEGICQIVGLDDTFVWTATGSASVKRWRDCGRKRDRRVNAGARLTSSTSAATPAAPGITPTSATNLPPIENPFAVKGKRLSVEGAGLEQSSLLSRVDSRESRTVAFAPPPQTGRENSSVTGAQRLTTASGAPIACSVISMETETGRNGISYKNLICLGLPETPYIGAVNLAAAASVLSIPQNAGFGAHGRVPSISSNVANARTLPELERLRQDFIYRETTNDSLPLREDPDEVIAGRHGLVRALMLNDRQHVLTADTGGQVALWNIVHGKCIGRYSSEQVDEVYQKSGHADHQLREIGGRDAKEALEVVREHIEGEGAVVPWCTVDTRIGSLTVHLEEGRVFDAEAYTDEVGLDGDEHFHEDQRINLGKWVLANLFAGLIKAEALEVQQDESAKRTTQPDQDVKPPSNPNAPTFISIQRVPSTPGRRNRPPSFLGSGPATPGGGLMIGLSTPAATPAILPTTETGGNTDLNAWRRAGLATIPQSPSSASPTTATPSTTAPMRSPKDAGGKDYFSFRTKVKVDSSPGLPSEEHKAPTTPGGTSNTSGLSMSPVTQSSGGLMGRLKGFGGKRKNTMEEKVPVASSGPKSTSENDSSVPDTPQGSEQDLAQIRLLAAVRSHPFNPPPYNEAPPLPIPRETALLISEESRDAGAWATTYRSMVSRTEEDMEPLEMAAPGWMLDYLFAGRQKVKDPVKLCFVLEPWPGVIKKEHKLAEMPDGNSRLTANRVLRVRKVLQYIYDRLDLSKIDPSTSHSNGQVNGESKTPTAPKLSSAHSSISLHRPGQTTSGGSASDTTTRAPAPASPPTGSANREDSTHAEELIEVVCNGVVVPVGMTLAAVRQYIWMSPLPTGFQSAFEEDTAGSGVAGDKKETEAEKKKREEDQSAADAALAASLGGGQLLSGGGDVTLYYRIKSGRRKEVEALRIARAGAASSSK